MTADLIALREDVNSLTGELLNRYEEITLLYDPRSDSGVTETAVWQPEAIEKLRDQLGDEPGVLVREIISLYLVQARDLLAQMEVAARQSDEYPLRGMAHSLKGSTATVGGARLAAVCERIEHASSAELRCPDLVRSAQQEFERLAVELERYRPPHGADSARRRASLAYDRPTAGRFPA